jgi:hypothetical protein
MAYPPVINESECLMSYDARKLSFAKIPSGHSESQILNLGAV